MSYQAPTVYRKGYEKPACRHHEQTQYNWQKVLGWIIVRVVQYGMVIGLLFLAAILILSMFGG